VLSGDGDVYQAVVDSFENTLDNSADKDHSVIRIRHSDFMANNGESFDLIIAVGTIATRVALDKAKDTPILSIYIPRNSFTNLVFTPQTDIAAIVIDQPLTRYQVLARHILGKRMNRIGIFYNGRKDTYDLLTRKFSKGNLKTVLEAIDDHISAKNISNLLDRSDVIVLLPGFADIPPYRSKWLLYMAYRDRVPIVAFSDAYVRAGAIAAISTTPDAIGKQAAKVIASVLQSPAPLSIHHNGFARINYPETFSVYINAKVAEQLDIDLPEPEILKKLIEKAVGNNKSISDHAD